MRSYAVELVGLAALCGALVGAAIVYRSDAIGGIGQPVVVRVTDEMREVLVAAVEDTIRGEIQGGERVYLGGELRGQFPMARWWIENVRQMCERHNVSRDFVTRFKSAERFYRGTLDRLPHGAEYEIGSTRYTPGRPAMLNVAASIPVIDEVAHMALCTVSYTRTGLDGGATVVLLKRQKAEWMVVGRCTIAVY